MKKQYKKWTERQKNYLRRHYSNGDTKQIAEYLKRPLAHIYAMAKKLGIKKSREFRREIGIKLAARPESMAYRFQKGHRSSLRGKRQSDFMSPEGLENAKKARFRKGEVHNIKPVGYESVDKHGYVRIKIAEGQSMVLKHRWVWQQHHGEIPEGFCVSFKDGNSLNCDIDNLFLLSLADRARRNIMNESAETRKMRLAKTNETKKKMIRRDRLRIHWGLEPYSKLVKKW